jgi:hypothetical protein
MKNFIFSTSSRPALGSTQLPVQWVPGALSSRVKWLGHEADHSPPTSAEVEEMWFYISTSPYVFIPVTSHGGPLGCERLRLPHYLDKRLIDGGKVVSPTRRPQ